MKTSLAALAALALASACTVDDHGTVQLFAICAPPDDAEQCGTDGTCERIVASDRLIVYTMIGPGFTNRLEMFVQVNNQKLNNFDPDVGRVNTNDFVIEDYLLDFGGAGAAVPSMSFPAGSFTVPAEGSQTPIITLIPEAAMEFLIANLPSWIPGTPGELVTVDVRLKGRFVSGERFETGVFRVAVDVRNNIFPGFACPDPTEIVIAVCPNDGQTASIACEAPDDPAPAP